MLLRRFPFAFRHCATLSTLAETKPRIEDFRTIENNPVNHNLSHAGRFYTIEPATKKAIFAHGGIPTKYDNQIKTFTEFCLMVREPAIEIIRHIENTDFNRPTNRFVLYGNEGCGKSLALAHLIHYGYEKGFLLVHIPWLPYWYKHPKEHCTSATKEGMYDLPLDAAAWLIHFKAQNVKLLEKLNLRLSKDYVWSKRESTPAGAPLSELIEHGINRAKYACDVIEALLGELKGHSNEGRCKTMVAIDGYNAFYNIKTNIRIEHKVMIPSNKVTLRQPFLDLTKYDWKNGVCVLTVDKIAGSIGQNESEFPMYLLGRDGFEHLDPFIPIRCNEYTNKEFYSCIQYYLERKWLQHTEKGFEKELEFLSNKNPYHLMELCKSL